jgi:hypothetical protein
MSRVKRGYKARRRRKKILKLATQKQNIPQGSRSGDEGIGLLIPRPTKPQA